MEPSYLPLNFHPKHYKIQIHPTLNATFSGIADIVLTCIKKTETIVLDVDNLHINHNTVTVVDELKKQKLYIQNQNYDKNKFSYTIGLNTSLEPYNNYTIHIEFYGNTSTDFVGLYQTIYNNKRYVFGIFK